MSVKNKHRAGFALLELLIGIAMLALLATIVSGSLTFGRRVWERAEAISHGGKQMAALGYLRRQITQALVIPPLDLNNTEQTAPFDGAPDALSFASFQPTGDQGLDQPYMLSLARLPEDDALTITFAPLFEGAVAEEKRPIRLLPGLSDIKLRYYGRMVDGDATRWRTTWRGQPWLPQIVELQLTFADGGEVVTRSLTIRPRLH